MELQNGQNTWKKMIQESRDRLRIVQKVKEEIAADISLVAPPLTARGIPPLPPAHCTVPEPFSFRTDKSIKSQPAQKEVETLLILSV